MQLLSTVQSIKIVYLGENQMSFQALCNNHKTLTVHMQQVENHCIGEKSGFCLWVVLYSSI